MSIQQLLTFDIRQVPLIPGAFVSDAGEVFTRDRSVPQVLKPRKPYLGNVGYYVVTFQAGAIGARRSQPHYIHRMVAEAFLPKDAANNEVRHLDGTRTNNSKANLAWGTRKENVADMRRHGTMLTGANAPGARLSVKDVEVARYLLDRGASVYSIAAVLAVSWSAIKAIKSGKSWSDLPNDPHELVR